MPDYKSLPWYVSEPRSVFAQVGDEPDADKDIFVLIADDGDKAQYVVDLHTDAEK